MRNVKNVLEEYGMSLKGRCFYLTEKMEKRAQKMSEQEKILYVVNRYLTKAGIRIVDSTLFVEKMKCETFSEIETDLCERMHWYRDKKTNKLVLGMRLDTSVVMCWVGSRSSDYRYNNRLSTSNMDSFYEMVDSTYKFKSLFNSSSKRDREEAIKKAEKISRNTREKMSQVNLNELDMRLYEAIVKDREKETLKEKDSQ